MIKNEKHMLGKKLKNLKYHIRTNLEINSKATISTIQTNSISPPIGSLPQSFLSSNDDIQEAGINQTKANVEQSFNFNIQRQKTRQQHERALSQKRDGSSNDVLTKEDDFMYKQMFRKAVQERNIPIDNLFNIIFAESEHEFASHCTKLYKQTKAKGRLLVRNPSNNYLQLQLKEMNKKMFFIKGILNFMFPGLIIKKISEQCKQLKKNNIKKFQTFIPPYQAIDCYIRNQQLKQSDYLSKSLLIKNKSSSSPNLMVR